jgi:hypothetical protein
LCAYCHLEKDGWPDTQKENWPQESAGDEISLRKLGHTKPRVPAFPWEATGLRSDQIGKLLIPKSRGDFPTYLRKVHFYDETKQKQLVFLTNNLQTPALTVAKIYKKRWEIEFFSNGSKATWKSSITTERAPMR